MTDAAVDTAMGACDALAHLTDYERVLYADAHRLGEGPAGIVRGILRDLSAERGMVVAAVAGRRAAEQECNRLARELRMAEAGLRQERRERLRLGNMVVELVAERNMLHRQLGEAWALYDETQVDLGTLTAALQLVATAITEMADGLGVDEHAPPSRLARSGQG